MIQPVLPTSRLVLRPLGARDDGQFWRLRTDPVVVQWLDGPRWNSIDEAREQRLKLQSGIEGGKWFFWGLSETASGPLLGTVCLWNFSPDRTDAEVGFDLFPSRQGRGLMAESLDAVLAWAWGNLPLQAVSALTHHDNAPARRFLEKRGFECSPIPADWEVVEAEAATQVYYRLPRPGEPITAPT